jgi:hypothetical protein
MTSNLHTNNPSPNARLGRKYGEAHACAFTSPFDCVSVQPTKLHNCLTVYLTSPQNQKPACTGNAKLFNCPTVSRMPTEATNRLKTEATAHTGNAKPFDRHTATTTGPAPGNVVLDATAPLLTTTTKEVPQPSTHSLGQRGTVSTKQPLKLVLRQTDPGKAISVINTHKAATGMAETSKSPNTDTTPAMGTYTRNRNKVDKSFRTISTQA